MRTHYRGAGIDESEVAEDPMDQFRAWFDEAVDARLPEPNAMVLATATAAGRPSARHVLLKVADEGFVFFTNYASRKSTELAQNPFAAVCFPWFAMSRQVSASGRVRRLDGELTRRYWAARPRDSQLGAWASRQSEPIADRSSLVGQLEAVTDRFAGRDVPLPEFWGGYRLEPDSVEFWQGRPGRLHDRIVYTKDEQGWAVARLQP